MHAVYIILIKRPEILKAATIATVLALALSGQGGVNQPASRLIFLQVVQGLFDPAATGRARVLEFWSTSCAPCAAAIPHLNQLADQFKDRAVDFIFITTDDRATVEAFLKKRPMRGVVALDPTGRLSKDFGARLADAILISHAGEAKRVVTPDQVSAGVLEDLLADLPPRIPSPPPVKMGQPAPKLEFREVVQGRFDDASSGKARLLEFWASWCGPCVAAIPHLNELAD